MGEKELIIVGSGPAAWTAALYAARAELKPLVYTGVKKGGQRGGQLTTTTEVENFPGFPLGVTGPELVRLMEEQARRFGIEVYEEDVVDLEIGEGGFIVKGTVNSMRSSAVILATGAYAKKIAIPGSDALWNRGISACAVCDGALPIFRNKELAVIGGGDSACEEALFLSKYASKVYLIVRRNVFRASKIMEERVRKHEKIEILFESTVEYAYGENALEHIEVKCKDDMRKLTVSGLFFAIGHEPNTELVRGKIELDDVGYVVKKEGTTQTSVPGLFAAGDVVDKRYRQAITAAGMGCMAALDAEKWLSEKSAAHT